MTRHDRFVICTQLLVIAGQCLALYIGGGFIWAPIALIMCSTAIIAYLVWLRREYFRGED